MQTIVIEQAKVELDLDQLVLAIKSLDAQQRQLVLQALDADWSKELDEILANVRERFEAAPMTEAEIAVEVKEARADYYAHHRG
jgi:phage shock protein A